MFQLIYFIKIPDVKFAENIKSLYGIFNMKKLTLSKAKARAWKSFSLYIRLRDSNGEYGECFTCGRTINYKQGQAGHFVQGRHNSTLFVENNCHLQCVGCNIFKSGNLVEYTRKMIDKYGIETVDMLRDLNNQIEKYKIIDYLELEKFFKRKAEGL